MRKILLTVLALALMLVWSTALRANDDTRALLEKALKAHGGKEKLAKFKAAETKGNGKLHILGGFDFVLETSVQMPDKFKTVMNFEIMNQKVTQTTVINGDNMWVNVNGMNIDLDKKLLKEAKESLHAEAIMGLVFLRDKGYELAALGEIKVDDKPAMGLRVTCKGHRDVNVYFDKQTALLVKIENRALDATTMQEVTQEKILSDYKDIDGVKRPGKLAILHDGKKFLEMEITEVKVVDKIDDNVFAKP